MHILTQTTKNPDGSSCSCLYVISPAFGDASSQDSSVPVGMRSQSCLDFPGAVPVDTAYTENKSEDTELCGAEEHATNIVRDNDVAFCLPRCSPLTLRWSSISHILDCTALDARCRLVITRTCGRGRDRGLVDSERQLSEVHYVTRYKTECRDLLECASTFDVVRLLSAASAGSGLSDAGNRQPGACEAVQRDVA